MRDKLRRWWQGFQNYRNFSAELNRRVGVENELLMMAAGRKPLPSAEKCREMAMKLGVPDSWSKGSGGCNEAQRESK